MSTLPYVTVDAFTTVKFRGNPAAIVVFPKENTVDALSLRQRQRQKEEVVWTKGLMPARTALAGKDGFPPDTFLADVAREMQLSETAFVKCRPPPRSKKQPPMEGEAEGMQKSISKVSFGGVMNGDVREGSDAEGEASAAASPAPSIASDTSSVALQKKKDRDAIHYVEYDLRWFTRSGVEVDLCGHATLAAAHALYELGPGVVPDGHVVRFHTRSGLLPVARVKEKKSSSDDLTGSDAHQKNLKKSRKRSGPLLELILPYSAPRLAALGGEDDAGAASDDSDDEFFQGKENATQGADASNYSNKDSNDDSKDSNDLKPSDVPPGEVGCFFDRTDVASALNLKPNHVDAIVGRNNLGDVFVSLVNHQALQKAVPDLDMIKFITKGGRGFVVTAPGGSVDADDGKGTVDFSVRFFGPNIGIDEDPVTGSAFVGLAPYWQKRLKRQSGQEMVAHQMSQRGGVVRVAVVKKKSVNGGPDEVKTHVRGRAVSVLKGEILGDGFDPEE